MYPAASRRISCKPLTSAASKAKQWRDSKGLDALPGLRRDSPAHLLHAHVAAGLHGLSMQKIAFLNFLRLLYHMAPVVEEVLVLAPYPSMQMFTTSSDLQC